MKKGLMKRVVRVSVVFGVLLVALQLSSSTKGVLSSSDARVVSAAEVTKGSVLFYFNKGDETAQTTATQKKQIVNGLRIGVFTTGGDNFKIGVATNDGTMAYDMAYYNVPMGQTKTFPITLEGITNDGGKVLVSITNNLYLNSEIPKDRVIAAPKNIVLTETVLTATVEGITSTFVYAEDGTILAGGSYTDEVSTIPFYLSKTLKAGDKVYVQSFDPVTDIASKKVYVQLGVPFKEQEKRESIPIYRVYNPNNGGHLYTANQREALKTVDLGWHDENIAWNAPTEGQSIYRLYNPNSGEHFYTINVAEYDAVGKAGWNQEGKVFYSDTEKDVPVYRLFNPNAKGPGSHHYTTSIGEKNRLSALGWKNEGTAFYGVTN